MNNVQEILGYTLDGGNPHEYLLMMIGGGRNGKSVTLRTLLYILGDYGSTVNPLTLMEFGNTNVSPERIRMMNKKLIVAQEPQSQSESAHKKDTTILDASFLKGASGGDKIQARELYSNTIEEFRIIGLITFATNELPKIKDGSVAFWERLIIIPFNYIIPEWERKEGIDKEFEKVSPGILNWLLEGFVRTKTKRIQQCMVIKNAVSEYRETADSYAGFLHACIEPSIQNEVTARKMYEVYVEYQNMKGKSYQNETVFARDMGKRLNKKKRNDATYYQGIKIVESQKTIQ